MELKPGYKKTEAGIIPEDWGIYTFAEVFEFLNTANNPRSDLSEIGDYKYIHYGDVHANQSAFFDCEREDIPRIQKSRVQHLPLVEDGDLIMVDASEDYEGTGVSVEVKNIKEQYVVAGLHTLLLRGNKEFITNGYKGYIQSIRFIKQELIKIATGISVYGISKNNLKRISIPLPPLPEQRLIATALSDVDALIAVLDTLIAKKRLVKQGAMQELLTGKKRLPGFSREWETKKIAEITHTTAGGTPSTLVESYWGGEIKWMSSGELHLKRVYDVDGRITEEGLQNSSTKIIPPNCVLIGLAGQGKTRGTVAMNMVELCTNQSIAAVFPSNVFIPDYLYYNLDSRYEELRSISTGDGGRGGLNLTLINNMEVPLPSLNEQQAIAEILSDMDYEITALEGRREKTRLLKQGMMQELLTGRIRLT
jgi:type I restriction enzyme S subunit